KHFSSFLQDGDRYGDMVAWAEKIDSAEYISVDEAILGDHPALKINVSLMSPSSNDDYSRWLVQQLRRLSLAEVAGLDEVRSRYSELRTRLRTSLRRMVGKVRLYNGVATLDIRAGRNGVISRYAPYHFFPDAPYSISVVRNPDAIKITAMRNPWQDFRSVPLGKMFRKFGGGGHERVGAVVVKADDADRVKEIVDSVLGRLTGISH
ncbi:MAG: hypothetical protein ACRD3Q_19245, partial [Terriglobales bacterium]